MTQQPDHISKQVLDITASAQTQFVASFRHQAKIKTLPSIARLLSKEKRISHSMEGSCNKLLDAASNIFAMLGKLKTESTAPHEEVLRREFLDELDRFEKKALRLLYPSAYLTVCRYVLCATIDDLLLHDIEFEHGTWESYTLLSEQASARDVEPDKFFAILARASDSTPRYIDLLELMYICLSYGYQGELRYQTDGAIVLDRIRNHLYERIRKERGQISQRLLFQASTNIKKENKKNKFTLSTICFSFILTLCIIMIIFIGFNYLMDIISNEATRSILPNETLRTYETIK